MSGKMTFTYWPLHGLGATSRMALHFAGVEFADEFAKADNWFGEGTKQIAEKNALVNLPHLTTESGEVIVQSLAILRHIGRTQKLYGNSPAEAARVDQLLDFVVELRTEVYKAIYAPKEEFAAMKKSFADVSLPYYFGSLEKFITANGTKFFASDAVTVADFAVLDLVEIVETMYGDVTVALADYPKVVAFYTAMKTRQELKSYYASAAAATGFNAPGANVSAVASL